ncbi:MAG: hypothetical protein C0478_11250 [Planctomyces sp.]|nr:hypothetical protein [Planctomyces sp.]
MAVDMDVISIVLFLTGLTGLIWLADWGVADLCREVWGVRWGLPKEYQQAISTKRGDQYSWRSLGLSRINGTVTNTLFAATSDDGLAFTARSLFRQPVMRTVVVPWSQLRIETLPQSPGMVVHTLLVMDETGEVATRIEPQWLEKKWIERIKCFDESPSFAGSGQDDRPYGE